jgi:hypothetical protein
VAVDDGVGIVLLSVAVLRLVEEAQLSFRCRERIRDRPIVWIDAHEALSREIGIVLRAFDGVATKRVGSTGSGTQSTR